MNLGQTVLKVKSIDPEINYIGFEPNVVCVNYLYKLIKLNNITNIKVIPIGLSSSNSLITLFADNEFASGASVIKGFRKNQKIKFNYNIPVFSGDYIRKYVHDKWDIVKIDVEGFEADVILGIETLIESDKPTIICEVLPNYGNSESDRYKRQSKLEQLLIKLNYSIYRIDESNVNLVRIDTIGLFDSMEMTNYLFQHHSRIDLIEELIKK
jgi:FkbM family methyltransferase